MATTAPSSRRPLLPRMRLLGEVLYHQVDRDRVFMQAAALTYQTLFSLLPIFVLSLLMLSTISVGEGRNSIWLVSIITNWLSMWLSFRFR